MFAVDLLPFGDVENFHFIPSKKVETETMTANVTTANVIQVFSDIQMKISNILFNLVINYTFLFFVSALLD